MSPRAKKKAKAAPAPAPKLLFKVLVDGKSCHGGSLAWSLPVDGKPGEWHEVSGEPVVCRRGLHLTDWVASWWKPGCKAYVVEAEGIVGDCDNDRKCVAKRVRLMREATEAELAASGVFLSGSHEVRGDRQIIARDNSRVVAWDNSSVEAWDNSRVVARDNSRVVACGSSRVVARDNSSVEAWDNSRVVARDNSSVEAWDNSRVVAKQNVTIVSWKGSDAIRLEDCAVLIDRSGAKPVVHVAEVKP